MKFFIPLTESAEEAEEILHGIAEATGFSTPSPRISAIEFTHDGRRMMAIVGKPLPEAKSMMILMFLHHKARHCYGAYSVFRNDPEDLILIGERDVIRIEYFDE